MNQTLELLQRFSEACGPPGGEEPVARLVRDYLGPFCQLSRDGLGSVLAEKPGTSPRPRLMLAAHLDEIGFMVQSITAQGYLRLQALGGWTPSLAPGMRLLISGARGEVEGIVSTVPIHHQGDNKKEVKIEDLLVDVGAASAAEVGELGVEVGNLIVPRGGLAILNRDLYLNKAWDDRVGVAAMVTALLELRQQAHPNTIIAAATVQEEVGVRGATTAVEVVRPDAAIVLEGPPADDYPGLISEPQGAVGGGCQIRLFDPSIIVPRPFWQMAVRLAQEKDIPHQLAVRRSGSTDARVIHLAQGGIPTLILGVPVRYAHSGTGLIHRRDFDAMVALVTALIQELDQAAVQGLRCPSNTTEAAGGG